MTEKHVALDLEEHEIQAAIKRGKRSGNFYCIGGIGKHAGCYGHFPPCVYCYETYEPARGNPQEDGNG